MCGVWVSVCVWLHLRPLRADRDHIFFSHSFISGHSGGFHILALVSNAAIIGGVGILFKLVFWFSWANMQQGCYWSHALFVIFPEGPLYWVPRWLHQLTLANSAGGFSFLRFLANSCYVLSFDSSHSARGPVVSSSVQLRFWYVFLWWLLLLNIFSRFH